MWKSALPVAVAMLFAGAPALAQEGRLETVTVTASMVDNDELRAAPAVYRRIPADFVLTEVTYQSGSRDGAVRKRELSAMFDRLKKEVAKTAGYELQGGEIGYSSASIDTVAFGDIYFDYNGQAHFTLTLSVDTKPGETFDQLMRRATEFIGGIKAEGRAEAWLGDEQFIGARNIGAHRADLMADIRQEAEHLQTLFQPSSVTVGGLESRVITQPSGPLELEIFIPYTLTVKSVSAGNTGTD